MNAKAGRFFPIFIACFLQSLAIANSYEYRLGDLYVEHPYIVPTPPRAPVAGAYLDIRNVGAENDRFLGGTASFCSAIELHDMEMNDGMMKMGQMKNGLNIPSGATVRLRPGGMHLMCRDLSEAIVRGKSYPATLIFEKAGSIQVEFSTTAPR